jgi:hypothetical protein
MTADLDSRWIETEIASIGQFACQIKNLVAQSVASGDE